MSPNLKPYQIMTYSNIASDPLLLTPGPLTTSVSVKRAMLHDLGSRDKTFIDLTERIRLRLTSIAQVEDTHVCIPLQGSGTFVVEAMMSTLLAEADKILILANGAYGQRIVKICARHGINHEVLEWPENEPVDPVQVSLHLSENESITHVVVVHCETTTGIINPLQEIADVVAISGRLLLIDSMSAFGAIPLGLASDKFTAVAASSNKCLQGLPGVGFCIVSKSAIQYAQGNSKSLVLDLHDQWKGFELNKQWRFTPPTHVLLGFDQALNEFDAEGGINARHKRYNENCKVLVDGMRSMGFETLLPDAVQAPIIVTFLMPADPNFAFEKFYDELADRGYVIYPGKLTVAETFRMGCIGDLNASQISAAVDCVREVIELMHVKSGAPS